MSFFFKSYTFGPRISTGYKQKLQHSMVALGTVSLVYNEYLFYVYSSHGSGGYFALSYVNGSFTGTGPIFAYEIYYK